MFYDSPVSIVFCDEGSDLFNETIARATKDLSKETDNAIYRAVSKLNVIVEKDKLIQALEQDRKRYEGAYSHGYKKGYDAGYMEAVTKMKDLVMNFKVSDIKEERK